MQTEEAKTNLDPRKIKRAKKDFKRFWRRHQTRAWRTAIIAASISLFVNAILIIREFIGLFTHRPLTPRAAIVSLAGFIPGFAILLWDTRKYRQELEPHVVCTAKPLKCIEGRASLEDEYPSRIKLTEVQPSVEQKKLGFKMKQYGSDTVFQSDSIDNALIHSHAWTLYIDEAHLRLVNNSITKNREACIPYLTSVAAKAKSQNKLLINEEKWCLASEINPTKLKLAVHKGGYFESTCTNELCMKLLSIGLPGEGEWKFDGSSMYPITFTLDGQTLCDLNSAPVNNHVGVSTLAISDDNYVTIYRQLLHNIQSPGKLVPTGSGSADSADLELHSLEKSVINGMQRECGEESSRRGLQPLTDVDFKETHIIGFFRWLDRGGKPEFIGISRLKVNRDTLRGDDFETSLVRNKAGRQLENQFSIESIDDVFKMIATVETYEKEMGIQLSLPLKLIFNRIATLASDNSGSTYLRRIFGW